MKSRPSTPVPAAGPAHGPAKGPSVQLLLIALGALACGEGSPPPATDPQGGPAEAEGASARAAEPAPVPDQDDPATGPVHQGQGLAIVEPHHEAHPGWRDLGAIALGEFATHTVELENREGRPLTVQSIRAGCACTVPSIGYRGPDGELVRGDVRATGNVLTIPTGAPVELTLTIDSRRAPVKNKPKRVNVRIITDSPTKPYLTVEAQFVVETPFQVAPETVDFGEVAVHGIGQASVRILRLRDRSPTGVVNVPAGFEVTLEESYYLGNTSWDLKARVLPPVDLGFAEHLIALTTVYDDGLPGPDFELPLRITGVPDLELTPTRLVLRELPAAPTSPGGPAPASAIGAEVVLASNLGGHRINVSNPRLEGPLADLLEVELVPASPDDALRSPSWTVRLTATGALPDGQQVGTLTLDTDDPEHPRLEIPYLRLERP